MNRSLAAALFSIGVLYSGVALSGGRNTACKAQYEINPNLVNAVGIKSYMDSNNIHDIGDLVCCLPKSFKTTAMFAHSSISGQNSNFASPRAILYSQNKDGTLKTALSFNGGDSSLHQNQNIEFMQTNSETKHIELFDLQVEKSKSTLSGRNPSLCLSCHGDYGVSGVGGPHPIFDPFEDWQRFQGGTLFFCGDNGLAYQKLLDEKTDKSIKGNPRYRCLDSSDPRDRSTVLNRFDNVLDRSNGKRLVEIIRSTPDFDKFKYATIGAQLCGFGFAFAPTKTKFDLVGWLPQKAFNQLSDRNFLPGYLNNSNSIKDAVRTEAKRFKSMKADYQKAVDKSFQQISNGEVPEFVAHRKGCPIYNVDSLATFPHPEQDLLNRYLAARIQSGSEDGALRFIFEGRGIDTAGWEMSATPGDYARPAKLHLTYLFELEKSDKTISDISNQLNSSGAITEIDSGIHTSRFEPTYLKICEQLKNASLRAWENQPASKQDRAHSIIK